MVKRILSLATCFFMLFTVSASAVTTNNSRGVKEIQSDNIEYWRSKFPKLDTYLNQNPESKLVGEDEIYIKYTLKDDTKHNAKVLTELDYNQEVYTREQYELEMSKERVNIGPSIPVDSEPYWLRLDLQVYHESGNKFMAYSFWEWKTKPVFLFTDLNGIYVSEGAVVDEDIAPNVMASQYAQLISDEYMKYTDNEIDVEKNSKGMMGIIDINGGSEVAPVTAHMGMTQTPISRINTSVTSIFVYTSYIHKQIAVGSPSFDSQGKPSFGLNISTDEHAARVKITF